MSESITGINNLPKNNRICERLKIEKNLKLYLVNKTILDCISTDISLGGINLLYKNVRLHSNFIGTDADLALDNIDKIFSCKIVRISNNQLAVEINKKQAASFGMALTNNMFSN